MSSKVHKRLSVEELRSIVKPIAEEYGVGKVYLFGSVARGDFSKKSDYDFCIELGKIEDLFEYSGFFQDLRDAIGHEIDLVDTEAINDEFLETIMKEGVALYGAT
ncbi:MAG: nucleotidyltransferase domain-containing protein [Methanomassiliicoccaceae archaeon]|nr:nucleotidyltransferase domain-containing protein [Methanomassiliicoccaceae archaeon]